MTKPIRILHLEHSSYDAELIQAMLMNGGIVCEIMTVGDRAGFIAQLERGMFDLILSDYSIPGFDELSALTIAQEKTPDVPFIFVSAAIGEERAIDSLKHGATDYVLKQRLSRLVHVVRRTLQEAEERSERRLAEKALKDNQERFRSIVESSQEWIWEVDPGGRLTFSNPSVKKILGYTPEELLGRERTSILHPQDKQLAVKLFSDFVKEKKGWTGLTFRWQHKAGSFRWLESNASPILGEQRELIGFRGVTRDVTERINGEEKLRQSEERFRLIAENVADMIALLDLEGKRLYTSPSYGNILGDPQLLKGSDAFQEILPDDRERVRQIFFETIANGIGKRTEYQLRAKDGNTHFIESHDSLIRDEKGRPFSVLVVSRDVTERKKTEQERHTLQEQLRQSQKMESIGTLAGGLAHDFNNLLGVILGYATLLQQSKIDPDKIPKALDSIHSAAQRGTNLVRQLLTFARKTEGVLEPVHINSVVEELLKIISATFPKNIKCRAELGTDLLLVSADPGQIHQALLNLFVNARDAMPKGGSLTAITGTVEGSVLRAKFPDAQAEKYVVLSVADTGTGISAETRKRIFEPFFSTKDKEKGTGLGLSVLYGILKAHQGFVDLESEMGKGTTFHLYFPVQHA